MAVSEPLRRARYWWSNDPEERYWVEIRFVEGLGTELRCPLLDRAGHANPWYDLIDNVKPGDIIYHWHAQQNGFVGKSDVVRSCEIVGDTRVVPLQNFSSAEGLVNLASIRARQSDILQVRDSLMRRLPGFNSYYLPFQFRSDGLRMMSNYFAKLPKELVAILFNGSAPDDLPETEPQVEIPSAQARMRFLEPFKPKRDQDYIARAGVRAERRTRTHETLVNAFANWLEEHGLEPGRNQAIDIGLQSPSVIIEGKAVTHWARAVREAVGQLYEYRYFQVVPPTASLIFLASKPVPKGWAEYLETVHGIGCAWFTESGFVLTPLASGLLNL
jgi:hypothetical protein